MFSKIMKRMFRSMLEREKNEQENKYACLFWGRQGAGVHMYSK